MSQSKAMDSCMTCRGDWTSRCKCSLCTPISKRASGKRYFIPGPAAVCDAESSYSTFEQPPNSSVQDGRKEQNSGRQEEKLVSSERKRFTSVSETLLDSLHCGKDSLPSDNLPQTKIHQRHSSESAALSAGYDAPPPSLRRRNKPFSALTGSVRKLSDRCRSCNLTSRRRCSDGFSPCGRETTDDECDCGNGKCHSTAFRPVGDRTRRPPKQKWSSDFDDGTDFSTDGERNDGRGHSPEKSCRPGNKYNSTAKNHECSGATRRRSDEFADEFVGREGLAREKQKFVDFSESVPKAENSRAPHADDETLTRMANVNENRRRKSQTSCYESQDLLGRPRRFSDPGPACAKRQAHAANCEADNTCFLWDPSSTRQSRCTPNDSPSNQAANGQRRRSSGDYAKSISNSTQVESTESVPHTSDNEAEEDIPARDMSKRAEPGQQTALLMTNLCELWKRHRLCDAVLHVNGHEFPVHKLAIAAFSSAFARRYCEGEPANTPQHIDIPDTSPAGLQQVLRFVYMGHITIGPDNVGDVLGAAAFLHIHQVVALCKEVLLQPDIDTVIQYSQLADKYRLVDDANRFYDFICEHFLRVARTRAWRSLAFNQVFDILSDDNLNVERELDVFQAAVAWIEADKAHRLAFAADLIGCVRFVFILPDEIAKHVETKQFLFQGDQGKELLLCIYRHHALQTCGCKHGKRLHRLQRRKYVPSPTPDTGNINTSAAFTRTLPVTSSSQLQPQHQCVTAPAAPPPVPPRPDVLLAIGGVNPFQPEVEVQVRQVEQFNPRSNHWSTLTRLPDGRHHHGAVLVGGAVYVIGGSVLDELNPSHLCNPTASCYRYQIVSGQWSAIAPLNVARMYHATAVLNGLIFVVAGQTHHSK